MKIAYAGIDLLACALETLISDGHEIIKIYSCKTDNVTEFNTRVTELANTHNIPITYERMTAADLDNLRARGCELVLCAAYYYLLPIDEKIKMVNIHPALLPMGRGAWPMPLTILKGLKKSGVTLHKMAASFDTGDILLQREFNLSEREDLVTFMQKACALVPEMVKELLRDIEGCFVAATPQGEGEYWECPDEYDYIITRDTPFDEADLILRAFLGYDCIYDDGETTHVLRNCRAVRGENSNEKFKVQGGYILKSEI